MLHPNVLPCQHLLIEQPLIALTRGHELLLPTLLSSQYIDNMPSDYRE